MLAKFDTTVYLNLHALVPHTSRNKLCFLGKKSYGKIPPTFAASVKITTPPPSLASIQKTCLSTNISHKAIFLKVDWFLLTESKTNEAVDNRFYA